MEDMINIREILQVLKKRFWIVVLAIFFTTSVSGVLSYFVIEPTYQANTTLYVGKNTSTEGNLGYQDVLLSGQLIKDYRELAKSRLVSNMVIDELGLVDVSASDISNMVGINLKSDTRIIEITAKHTNPEYAQKVANKVADVFKKKSVELIEVDNVQVIDKAETPTNPVKPNKPMNMAIGLIIGFMIGIGLVFLIEYLDNTIKTSTDVAKHLDMPILGTIPKFEGEK